MATKETLIAFLAYRMFIYEIEIEEIFHKSKIEMNIIFWYWKILNRFLYVYIAAIQCHIEDLWMYVIEVLLFKIQLNMSLYEHLSQCFIFKIEREKKVFQWRTIVSFSVLKMKISMIFIFMLMMQKIALKEKQNTHCQFQVLNVDFVWILDLVKQVLFRLI